jgi:hypothetical protein
MSTGNRGKTLVTAGVVLPSKVTGLVIQKPAKFNFTPGAYPTKHNFPFGKFCGKKLYHNLCTYIPSMWLYSIFKNFFCGLSDRILPGYM